MPYTWRDGNNHANESVMPISREEALKRRKENRNGIPDLVFEIVNELLLTKPRKNNRIIITQDEILDKLTGDEDCGRFSRQAVFDNGWLDFEDIYREVGWKVTYDKPGYNENYKPYFIFE